MAAPEGIAVGQSVAFGDKVSLRPGNVTTLDQIPEGTQICNVELRPGDGGKIARSGGNSAMIDTRMGDYVRVQLPSGRTKDLPSKVQGYNRGSGWTWKNREAPNQGRCRSPQGKGKRVSCTPTVSGVAMNPVDHPHGGGNHQAVRSKLSEQKCTTRTEGRQHRTSEEPVEDGRRRSRYHGKEEEGVQNGKDG